MKVGLKNRAIKLRRKGFTYSEILKQVPVAKSTLSLWLRSVGLSKRQKQRISKKKLEAAKRGARARKTQRLILTKKIKDKAFSEIGKINRKELKLIGTVLYWAEGTKSKKHSPSVGAIFSNSDPLMIKLFLKWLDQSVKVSKSRIVFEIFIHENHKENTAKYKAYWSNVTGFSEAKFGKIYFKKNKIRTKRKNIGSSYFGLLRIRVKRSTNLNRRIEGLIDGICHQCGVV